MSWMKPWHLSYTSAATIAAAMLRVTTSFGPREGEVKPSSDSFLCDTA